MMKMIDRKLFAQAHKVLSFKFDNNEEVTLSKPSRNARMENIANQLWIACCENQLSKDMSKEQWDGFKQLCHTVTFKAHSSEFIKMAIYLSTKYDGKNCELNWIDVSEVKGLQGIFAGTNFNGDISKWNLSDSDKEALWRQFD